MFTEIKIRGHSMFTGLSFMDEGDKITVSYEKCHGTVDIDSEQTGSVTVNLHNLTPLIEALTYIQQGAVDAKEGEE